MAKQVLLTTTGTPASFRVPDLGIGFTHPVESEDLLVEYRLETIRDSDSLQQAVDTGKCTLADGNGIPITNIKNYLTPNFSGEAVRDDGGRQNALELFQIEPYDASQVAFVADAVTAKYKIQWYAEICINKNNKSADIEVTLDGATTIAEFCHVARFKSKFESICGFTFQDITAGNHTIEFKVSAAENGVGVTVRRIAIAVEKK
jgi:hypothetical protein